MLGRTNAVIGGSKVTIDGEKVKGELSLISEKMDIKINNTPYTILTTGSAVSTENEIYILGGGTSSNNNTNYYFYKFDGSVWTKLANLPDVHYDGGNALAYDGEIYFVGYKYPDNVLRKWDGTTWTVHSTLPYRVNNSSGGVQTALLKRNDEIHIIGGTSVQEAHIKWNGSAWVSASTLPNSYFCYNPDAIVEWRNEIHAFSQYWSAQNADHYVWDGAEWTKKANTPVSVHFGAAVADNDGIYIFSNDNSKCTCYKWDGSVWTLIGTKPFEVNYAFKHRNKIYGVSDDEMWVIDSTYYRTA